MAQEIEISSLADSERTRIETWEQSELKKVQGSKEFFNGLLLQYAAEQRANDPKFKLSTPYGKLGYRKQQPKWSYDEAAVLKFLEENNIEDLIRVKKEIDKATLKKSVKVMDGKAVIADTGEVIEGINIIEQEDALKIEVGV